MVVLVAAVRLSVRGGAREGPVPFLFWYNIDMQVIESSIFHGPAPSWCKGSPSKSRSPAEIIGVCAHITDVSGGFGVSSQALARHDGDRWAALMERFEGSEYLASKNDDGKAGEPYHYIYRPQEGVVVAVHHPERYMWASHGLNATTIAFAVDGKYPGDALDADALAFAFAAMLEHAMGLGFEFRELCYHRQSSSARGGDPGDQVAPVLEDLARVFAIKVNPDHVVGSGRSVPESWRSSPGSSSSCAHPVLRVESMPSSKRDESVASMQALLLARGYGPAGLLGSDGRPDGKPGTGTARELRSFQGARGLAADAVCGEQTWSALFG